jgi:hypothetical protein
VLIFAHSRSGAGAVLEVDADRTGVDDARDMFTRRGRLGE